MDKTPKDYNWSEKLNYYYYRIRGHSRTQAEWHVNRMHKTRKKATPQSHQSRYKNCECGQLLLVDDKVCLQCGRKQHGISRLQSRIRQIDQPAQPRVMQTMMLLCLLVYGLQTAAADSFFNVIPRGMKGVYIMNALGAILPPMHLQEPWRLFSYTLLHGGLMHLGFNMMALYQIGPLVEKTFGSIRFLFLWIFTGAFAIVVPEFILGYARPTIGASGSIFGIIGVAMAYGHRLGTPQGIFIRNKMIEWTVICTLFGMMMGGIAHSAHFGGLAGGIILSFLLPPDPNSHRKVLSISILIISLIIIVWSLWMQLASIQEFFQMKTSL